MTANPWHHLPEQAPYVLPEDAEAVLAFNKRASEIHRLRVEDILPEPFVGRRDAPVLFLGTNPGFTDEGAMRKHEGDFFQRMRANLRHDTLAHPMVFFAPDQHERLKRWWNRKFKELLYLGYPVLSQSILAVEHFPYPSQRYGAGRLRLQSQVYSFDLVRNAMQRKRLVVLARGRRYWFKDVPELRQYDGLCELSNPMAGTVSPKNCPRFDDVVKAIELEMSSRTSPEVAE